MVVVVYDIADDKRRLKLSKLLEGYGRRVQESVFECFIELTELPRLRQAVARKVKLPEDNVRFYWIPANAVSQTLTLGSEPPQPPPSVYII